MVMLTPPLERTIDDALEGQGIELRRVREGETGMGTYRQAFFRVGRPILEVVEAGRPRRARALLGHHVHDGRHRRGG